MALSDRIPADLEAAARFKAALLLEQHGRGLPPRHLVWYDLHSILIGATVGREQATRFAVYGDIMPLLDQLVADLDAAKDMFDACEATARSARRVVAAINAKGT